MCFQTIELRYRLYRCPVNKLAGPLVYDSGIRGLLLGMGLVWLGKKTFFPNPKTSLRYQQRLPVA
jgi:hypothetical protein